MSNNTQTTLKLYLYMYICQKITNRTLFKVFINICLNSLNSSTSNAQLVNRHIGHCNTNLLFVFINEAFNTQLPLG